MYYDKNRFKKTEISQSIFEKLKTKHVILEGGNSYARKNIIESIRALIDKNYFVYELPSGICNLESYWEAIKRVYPLESPLCMDTQDMNYNQINDIQLDWVEFQSHNSFIIWHELKHFQQIHDLYEILDHYISLKYYLEKENYMRSFRLLVDSDILLDDYYKCARFLYPMDEDSLIIEQVKKQIEIISIAV